MGYRPWDIYHNNPELKAVLDLIRDGTFSRGDRDLFRPLVENLLHHDPYLLLADYQSYVDCQAEVGHAWRDPEHWARMSILNAARSGKFSSDRSIRDYCAEIWHARPVPVPLHTREELLGDLRDYTR